MREKVECDGKFGEIIGCLGEIQIYENSLG